MSRARGYSAKSWRIKKEHPPWPMLWVRSHHVHGQGSPLSRLCGPRIRTGVVVRPFRRARRPACQPGLQPSESHSRSQHIGCIPGRHPRHHHHEARWPGATRGGDDCRRRHPLTMAQPGNSASAPRRTHRNSPGSATRTPPDQTFCISQTTPHGPEAPKKRTKASATEANDRRLTPEYS